MTDMDLLPLSEQTELGEVGEARDAHGMEGYRVVLNLNQDGRHLKASATDLEPFIGSHFPGQMRCYQDSRTLAYLNHQVLGPGLLEEIV